MSHVPALLRVQHMDELERHMTAAPRRRTRQHEREGIAEHGSESLGFQMDRGQLPTRPGSTAERWGLMVIAASRAERDLKTLQDWASFVGTSYTLLAELCRLVHVRPTDARDLARVLRVIVQAPAHKYSLECLLDVSDRRTLRALLRRAGLSGWPPGHHISALEFLRSQRFVDRDNPAMHLLESFVSRSSRQPGNDAD